jgi:hypothetical protein
MVLVPGYLIELQNVINHIWQSYVGADGKTAKLSTQVNYSNFLNAICSFHDLKEYSINLAGIFQDHTDPALQKSFCLHYPNYRQTCSMIAITKRLILTDMLNALLKAKSNLTNICDIVHVEHMVASSSTPHNARPFQALPRKPPGNMPTTPQRCKESKGSGRNKCFGFGEPHPWSKMVDGKYVVVCPNANKPSIHKKAKLNISKYLAR